MRQPVIKWSVFRLLVGLVGLVLSLNTSAEQASRQYWVSRYMVNDRAPDSTYYTYSHADAFRFAEQRMYTLMRAAYGRCAPPIITFEGEEERTAGTGLLYYSVLRWDVRYLDGSGCSYWNRTSTAGEIWSRELPFETGPMADRSCPTTNPVEPGSGRKRLSHIDYQGVGAHPLAIKRYYNSRWMDGASAQGFAPISIWDGGWRHNWQASLTLRSGINQMRAFRPDGNMIALASTAADTWTASNGDTVTARVDATGHRVGYTYRAFADNSIETYDLSGKLLSVTQRNGWTATLTYSDATTPSTVAPRAGLLIAVRNQFGRELKFTYDALGRVLELLPPGAIPGQPAGSTISPIRYQYEEAVSRGATVPASGQLTSVTWQDGTVRRYHYEDGRWPQAVTGITDEAGVRYGSYAYDDQGRVTRSELAAGAERLDFVYGSSTDGQPTTTVTDYTGGTPGTRTYTFNDMGDVRYAVAVTAPCSLCGTTAQSTAFNAAGDKIKEIAHDGTVTFYAYDSKGRETERATFPSSFASAPTRPALSNASRVVSTRWHASFNLPTQIAEPNRITARTYNAKGMLTGQSWTATTDATGAAKFSAVKTGSTYATGWGYNANSLATSIVTRETAAGATAAVETGRWTLAYNTAGDLTKVTAISGGVTSVANLTNSAAHGWLTELRADNGAVARFGYNTRGRLLNAQLPDYSAALTYDTSARLSEVRFGPTSWLRIVYDSAGNPLRLEDSAGQSQLIVGVQPGSGIGGQVEAVRVAMAAKWRAAASHLRYRPLAQWLPMSIAHAQSGAATVPARVLQGMSLVPTQQAPNPLDPAQQQPRGCCGAATPTTSDVQDALNRLFAPIYAMSLVASTAAQNLSDDFLILKSARKLRKNLCAAKVTVPDGCHHAHHIVAVAAPRAQASRDVLAAVGLDINNACNGMFVSCDRHGRLHTNDYYDAVNVLLVGLPIKTQTTVCIQLGLIRANISSGSFP